MFGIILVSCDNMILSLPNWAQSHQALFCVSLTILPQANLTKCGSCRLAASKEPHAVLGILPQICRANRCSRSESKRINRTISCSSSILPQIACQNYGTNICGNFYYILHLGREACFWSTLFDAFWQ